jgi:hypothetical protein
VLRYVSVDEQIASHEVTIPITVNLVSADEAAAAEADHEVTEEVVVLMSARAQEQAREHADRGESRGAARAGEDARGKPVVDVGRTLPGGLEKADAVPAAFEPNAEEEGRVMLPTAARGSTKGLGKPPRCRFESQVAVRTTLRVGLAIC